jgi:hypothetical protein
MKKWKKVMLRICVLVLSAVLVLSGCSKFRSKDDPDVVAPVDQETKRKTNFGSIAGDDTFVFGGSKKKGSGAQGAGMRVNSYLWSASLDAISFMPLVSADANGGVIVTDWYVDEKKPSERIKVMIKITSIELRVEAIHITIHKQRLSAGQWVNMSDEDRTASTELENIILTKARHLRMQSK